MVLHSLDERMLYGCWVAEEWGHKLDRAANGFPYQTRVR